MCTFTTENRVMASSLPRNQKSWVTELWVPPVFYWMFSLEQMLALRNSLTGCRALHPLGHRYGWLKLLMVVCMFLDDKSYFSTRFCKPFVEFESCIFSEYGKFRGVARALSLSWSASSIDMVWLTCTWASPSCTPCQRFWFVSSVWTPCWVFPPYNAVSWMDSFHHLQHISWYVVEWFVGLLYPTKNESSW